MRTLKPAITECIALTFTLFTITQAAAQTADTRTRQIAGYPVDSGYRLQHRGPQQFTPVNEESSREQQYLTAQDQARQQQPQHEQQQPLFTPEQQQQPLFTPDQQQALLQQHYQAYAQLLNQQQRYISSNQQQQIQQQRLQEPRQFQQTVPQQQQLYQQQQLQQQQPQQLRQPDDQLTSTIALLGVKYSAAPSVARTMYRTNTGVNFSY